MSDYSLASGAVSKEILDNGLTVLVRPNRSAPVVAIVSLVKVGYYDEPDRLTGISHLLEHMFFKGTPTRSVGEMARQTKALGGYLNAGTIYDRTSYYTVLPSTRWREGLAIQADALANATLDPHEFDREKQVVIEEIKRKYDSPRAMAWEQMVSGLFSVHRTRRWRMGHPEQVAAFTREELRSFYEQYYRPNNCILAVVGDVEPDAVIAEVRQLYGAMEQREIPRHQGPAEPQRSGWSWRRETADIGRGQLVIGFQGDRFDSARTAALTVLATILGQGRSSRLYRHLKEQHGRVLDISTDVYANSEIGIFTISAEVEPGLMVPAEGAIFAEITRLAEYSVSQAELEKSRHMIEAAYLAQLSSMDGQANMLAEHEAFATYDFAAWWLQTLRAVTADDVQAACRQYLDLDLASVFEYWPSGASDECDQAQRRVEIEQARDDFRAMRGETDTAEEWPDVPTAVIRSSTDGPATAIALDGGATLIIKESHTLPTTSVGIYFRGGRVYEDDTTAGVTRLMLECGMKGTASRTAAQISGEFERMGAMLATTVSPDYFGYFSTFLSRTQDYGIDLMFDIVTQATYPQAEIPKEKDVLRAEVETRRDNMYAHPLDLFHSVLYGKHGYGLPQPGSLESLRVLERTHLQQWHHRFLTPQGLIMVVVGDVDREALTQRIQRMVGALPGSQDSDTLPPRPVEGIGECILDRDRAQTAIVLGFPTVPYAHEDYYALKILQGVASGMGGRLFVELRDRKALAYTVFGAAEGNALGGAFYTYIATSPDKEAEARAALLIELDKLKQSKITPTELEEAKSYLCGTFLIGLQTNPAQVGMLARFAAMGLQTDEVERYPERLRAVTAEDVMTVAQKYFDQSRLSYGVVRGVS